MAIEIVDWSFHSFLDVYQRVSTWGAKMNRWFGAVKQQGGEVEEQIWSETIGEGPVSLIDQDPQKDTTIVKSTVFRQT